MKLTVALIVLCVVATGSAQQPEAPFKHPKAVQAWNRYQFRENKAREAYDREVAAAKAEYLAGLEEAGKLAAQAGNLDEVKRIADAKGIVEPAPKPGVIFQGKRYLFIPAKVSWSNAKTICEAMGGQLVSINSESKARFIRDLTGGTHTWTSGTRAADGRSWRWGGDDTVGYNAWNSGQPESQPDRVYIFTFNGLWHNGSNDQLMSFVCEWR